MKKKLIIAAVVLVLLAAAAAALTLMASRPAERLKTMLIAAAQDRIGRKVDAGRFSGSPFTGFSVQDIRVSDVDRNEQPILDMISMKLGFSLRDLILERKIHFKSLEFIKPEMQLVVFEDGKNNFSDIMESIVSAPESGRAFPKIFLDYIAVHDGTLHVRIFRAGRKPLDFTLRGIECVLRPDKNGDFNAATLDARAALEKISAKVQGKLSLDRETVDIRWETSAFSIKEVMPMFTGEKDFAPELRLEGNVRPGGAITFRKGAITATTNVKLDTVKVMGLNLGAGELNGTYASDTVRFDLGLSKAPKSLHAKGDLTLGNTRELNIVADVNGFSSAELFKLFAPDLPKIINGNVAARVNMSGSLPGDKLVRFNGTCASGAASASAKGTVQIGKAISMEVDADLKNFSVQNTLGALSPAISQNIRGGTLAAKVHISGNPTAAETIAIDGDASITGGTIVYPTPSFKGEKNAKASLPLKTLSARFHYKGTTLTVQSARADGPGFTASGSGDVRLRKDMKTGRITGPDWFDARASVSAPEVARVLETNPHLGAFVSGKLATEARLRGNPNDLNSLTGAVNTRLARGHVTNPYVANARKLPLNDGLSHFDFSEIYGAFSIAKSTVGTNNLTLRSDALNADVKGSLGFDGRLNAHAEASLAANMLAQINEFKSILPKLRNLKEIKRADTSFELSGTVQKPKIHWNVQDVIEREAKKLLQDKASELLKQKIKHSTGGTGRDNNVEDVFKDKIKRKLKGIF
jgi:hypothetical protein